MKKVITLKDLAKELKLSVTTVSKAIRDYPDIGIDTRKRVQDLAKKYNFTPNTQAVNFRKKRTNIIGVIIPEVVHHFFSEVVGGIMSEAKNKGYMTLLFQSENNAEIEREQMEILRNYNVEGIIISLSNTYSSGEYIQKIQQQGVPIVLFDKIDEDMDCSKVVIDDFEAAMKATEHLIQQGRKRIGHIAGPKAPKNYNDRFNGYRTALIKNGIEYDEKMIYFCEGPTADEGKMFAKKLVTEQKCDAIFCATDLLAVGAMTGIKEEGLNIPYHVALVGFSDWFMSSVVSPQLTSVRQPGNLMGKECFRLLHSEIEAIKNNTNEDFSHQKIVLPTKLIIRESSVLKTL